MGEQNISYLKRHYRAVRHNELRQFYLDMISTDQLPEQEAFMTICYFYEKFAPEAKKGEIPKIVANIVNPDIPV